MEPIESVDLASGIDAGYTAQVRTVGQNIVAIREAQGLTQADLADRLGVRQPSVWKVETQTGEPLRATLRKYAKALGVTIDQLLEGTEPAITDALLDTPKLKRQPADSAIKKTAIRETPDSAKGVTLAGHAEQRPPLSAGAVEAIIDNLTVAARDLLTHARTLRATLDREARKTGTEPPRRVRKSHASR